MKYLFGEDKEISEKEFEEYFMSFDDDGDGVIEKDEISGFIRNFIFELDEKKEKEDDKVRKAEAK